MSNDYKIMNKNEVAAIYSAMAFALDHLSDFKSVWNISDGEMASFHVVFSEVADAADHHGIKK
jgi:hypothetical protein